jgi:hypothetical protein
MHDIEEKGKLENILFFAEILSFAIHHCRISSREGSFGFDYRC